MTILHLYPQGNAMMAQYVSMAERGMPAGVEVTSTDDAKTARQLCRDHRPDIIHLHGLPGQEMTRVAMQARRQGARLVLTPHGQLQPWKPHTSRSAPLVRHAYALIAQSRMEADNLAQLGWNDRIETILNPIITKTTTIDELLSKTLTIYNKVMASDVLALMDSDTKTALRLLLKAGIAGDKRWLGQEEVGRPDWQKLYVYTEQEGVAEWLKRGIEVTESPAPRPVAQPIYLPNGYKQPTPLGSASVVTLVGQMRDETAQGKLSLLRLVELNQALRHPALDEEVLLQELQLEKLNTFFASLLPVLSEQTGLDEGFMPCPPTDNRQTNQIRTTLAKHLKI